jgi:hypothetical protein
VECRVELEYDTVAKEMEKILPFICKYADGVEKRTH